MLLTQPLDMLKTYISMYVSISISISLSISISIRYLCRYLYRYICLYLHAHTYIGATHPAAGRNQDAADDARGLRPATLCQRLRVCGAHVARRGAAGVYE